MLPNLIVIGAQKGGTSSFYHYLALHPEIFMSSHKELNFFCKELTWKKRLRWYKSHFKDKTRKIRGEVSPAYTQYPLYKGVPERMHSVLPDAKLIYLVRNPIERMVSQYLDRFIAHHEKRRPEEAFLDKENRYIQFSKYFLQIQKYLKCYKKSQIYIIKNKDLRDNRLTVLKEVFKFLKVDNKFRCDEFYEMKNISREKRKYPKQKKPKKIVRCLREKASFLPKTIKRKLYPDLGPGEKVERPKLSNEVKEKVLDCLKKDINKLEEFSGFDLSDWFDERADKIS